jgi:cytochrome c oxidase subunit 4
MSSHAAHSKGHGDHHQVSVKFYWIFCLILCFITFLEWLVFKKRVEWGVSSQVMVPMLLIMSLVKFAMVIGWYMHLRFDHNWVKYIFLASLAMGGLTGIALVMLA